MHRAILITLTILLNVYLASAETVSLKGIVTKTGGTAGIAGVKVSLTELPELSATTQSDGTFILTGTTASLPGSIRYNVPAQFTIKGNTITLFPASKSVSGRVDILSIDGRTRSSVKIRDLSAGMQRITLSRLVSGISIIQITIGTETFTRAVVGVDNRRVVDGKPARTVKGGEAISSGTSAATAVDTLKAEKEGYLTAKVAIENYTMDNMTVTLDTSGGEVPGACSREALKAIADSYIAAQEEGDPSKMPLAAQVSYMQNNKTITAEKSICATAVPVDHTLSFFDVDSCRAFVEIISSTGTPPRVMMTWLKTENGKISGIDAMVSTTGDFMFNAKNYLKYVEVQDWSVLTESQKISRQEVIDGADAYLDMFADGVDNVPWGTPCERVEGGNMHVTPDCIVGMPGHGGVGGTVDINKRRYTVDVDLGTVDVFCSFGGAMPDSHLFRLIDGKIRLVHTLTIMK
jgi:hypothetical protein